MANTDVRRNNSVLHHDEFIPHDYSYLPDKLKIMGHTWKLGGMNPLVNRVNAEYTDGICDSARMEIAILPDLQPSQVMEILIHETIEALNIMLALDLEHNIITLLGLGIFQVLGDNGFLCLSKRSGDDRLFCEPACTYQLQSIGRSHQDSGLGE